MKSRQEILEDEFVRAPFPGLRIFSAGVLKLARKLGLSFALPASARRALTPEDADSEVLATTWLLDIRNDVAALCRAADLGRERFFSEVLAPYEFVAVPALIAMAQQEIALTNAAVEAAVVIVSPKPGDKPGSEPGNS